MCSQQPSVTLSLVDYEPPYIQRTETQVCVGAWSGGGRGYASPDHLHEQADLLARWSQDPVADWAIQWGGEDLDYTRLRFFTIDTAGHVVCQIELSTTDVLSLPVYARHPWCLSLEMRTEPGLIERFARHLSQIAESLRGEAVLHGVY